MPYIWQKYLYAKHMVALFDLAYGRLPPVRHIKHEVSCLGCRLWYISELEAAFYSVKSYGRVHRWRKVKWVEEKA